MLKPICVTARTYRLVHAARILTSYETARIPSYVGVTLSYQTGLEQLLVPPIAEVHGGDYVLIDGLHRLIEARQRGRTEVSLAIVRGYLPPLPGIPVSWDCITTVTRHTSRASKFRSFKPDFFRPIAQVLDSLWLAEGAGTILPFDHEEQARNNCLEPDEE